MRDATTRAATLVAALALTLAAPAQVLAPATLLGFEPGADRNLADYDEVYAWFKALGAASDRVDFGSIGKTTEGRELGLAVISSPKNLANLEAIRQDNLALADPRKLGKGDAERLIARGKTIVCLNASIHSNEVGPTQATLVLAHVLATTQDPAWLQVQDDVVLLMLPCHNPDGYAKQVAWYRKWVGTPHEACPLPGLYHRYAGHDNNRDWFMFNLEETRLTVTQIYRRWLPQMVMDMHQMQDDGPRMFTPPYQDPVEPNVPRVLVERLNELGTSVQKELVAKGMTGIVNRTLFDAWSPSRAYMHYHGGVRFLVEIASARLASPLQKKGIARRAGPRTETNPAPWSGERWALSDIVRYHNEAAMAVFRHASRNRAAWLSSFHENFRIACASTEGPAAFWISSNEPRRGPAFFKVLEVLEMGGLEASHAEDGSVLIERGQPFFPFARALLENVPYPKVRETESSPIRKPYDVTANSLALLMDVIVETPSQRPAALKPGWPRPRFRGPWFGDAVAETPATRVGLYDSATPNVMDAGWTRLFLERQRLAHRLVDDRALAALDPATLDVLILPSMTADMIQNGNRGDAFPPEFRGGIGDAGAAAIDRFVRGGGTLIALKDASAFPIQLFKMPLRNALMTPAESRRAYVPGAILRLDLDLGHPIAKHQSAFVPAMFDAGKAFEADSDPALDQTLSPVIVARWAPAKDLLLCGYAEGLDLLAGKSAIVECGVGRGRVVLFAFSPQFRCQTWATFPLFLNAITLARGPWK